MGHFMEHFMGHFMGDFMGHFMGHGVQSLSAPCNLKISKTELPVGPYVPKERFRSSGESFTKKVISAGEMLPLVDMKD